MPEISQNGKRGSGERKDKYLLAADLLVAMANLVLAGVVHNDSALLVAKSGQTRSNSRRGEGAKKRIQSSKYAEPDLLGHGIEQSATTRIRCKTASRMEEGRTGRPDSGSHSSGEVGSSPFPQ